MIYCHNCRRMFDEQQNRRGDSDQKHICPNCGEKFELERAVRCQKCGGFSPPHMLKHQLCAGCARLLEISVIDFWDSLLDAERDYIEGQGSWPDQWLHR